MKRILTLILVLLVFFSSITLVQAADGTALPESAFMAVDNNKKQYIYGAMLSWYSIGTPGRWAPSYPIVVDGNINTADGADYLDGGTPPATWRDWYAAYPGVDMANMRKTLQVRVGNSYAAGGSLQTAANVSLEQFNNAMMTILKNGFPLSTTWQGLSLTQEQAYYATNFAVQRLTNLFTAGSENTNGITPVPGCENVAQYAWYLEQAARKLLFNQDGAYIPLGIYCADGFEESADGQYWEATVTVRTQDHADYREYLSRTDYKVDSNAFGKDFTVASGNPNTMTVTGNAFRTQFKVRVPVKQDYSNKKVKLSVGGAQKEAFSGISLYSSDFYASYTGQNVRQFYMVGDELFGYTADHNLPRQSITLTTPSTPDLTVTHVTSNKTAYGPGETVTVSAKVRNIGGARPGAASIAEISGHAGSLTTSRTRYQIDRLPSGDTQDYTYTFQTPATITAQKTVKLTVTADADKTVSELREDNNTRSISITLKPANAPDPKLPDLIVSDVTINKKSFKPGEKVTIKAIVKNIGEAAAGSESVIAVSGHGGNVAMTSRGRWETEKLTPGQSEPPETFTFETLPTTTVKTITLTFTADVDGKVTEGNENNNAKSISFTVSPDGSAPPPPDPPTPPPGSGPGPGDPEDPEEPPRLPDFTISISPGDYIAGTEVIITAIVRNIGQASDPYVPVRLWFGSDVYDETIPVPTSDPESPTGSHPSGRNVAVFKVRVPNTPGATIPIRAYVDPDDYTLEENEYNNEDTATAYITRLNDPDPVDALHPSLEEDYVDGGKVVTPLPPTTPTVEHSWEEIRYEGGDYVLKVFTARLTAELEIRPDQRVSMTGVMESGFGIEQAAKTVVATNYDRPDKLVGSQFVYLTYPETDYNEGAREHMVGSNPGNLTSFWNYPNNPNSVLNMPLHYTPLWFPDRSYDVLCTAFYAWTPGGQATARASHYVTVRGDMYDRFTTVNW